ncbi:PadR family transcriptional regulator [Nonomuraea ferruginea]
MQDRFLGVYSPSPGTIYPRLARLEAEGLVTHEVADGKKVFSITDKGREELNARLGELGDLEREISASVRDIAREVKEDVRDTVKSLREELTRMARDVRTGTGDDVRRTRERQKQEFTRLKEEQKRQWSEHAQHWQGESERLARRVAAHLDRGVAHGRRRAGEPGGAGRRAGRGARRLRGEGPRGGVGVQHHPREARRPAAHARRDVRPGA